MTGSLRARAEFATKEVQQILGETGDCHPKEIADAIEREKWDELKGELGDLLFQSVFHAQMAKEAGHFTFQDVVTTMSNKMVSRHPHVFGDESRDKSADQQTQDWETIKAAERAAKAETGALDGVAVRR
ncbi:MazG nucleotide pyrophosphohydrolase domain-containing protein [Salinicola salarius]|uniref:MazG nucleotide pyrophosphohydrolase domain-containing protein n=1 Tax=Salinicola salarius TaxID=430457 RepID=UPI0026EC9966|nr:MazG nucleotide pyrophosphohydrolase domain-containing protein [Salinicola salarius]